MALQQRGGFSTPHWKGNPSIISTQDFMGCLKIPVRALNIIWGNDSRFWEWINLSDEDTRSIGFQEAAVLLQVNWIEVTGKFDLNKLFRNTTYNIYYAMKFHDDAFGWRLSPIKFKVGIAGEVSEVIHELESYRAKQNKWHEVPGGEFTVPNDTAGSVEFGMFEVDTQYWKGCMVLGGVLIKPKS
ncbi:unnamed protein product [Ilex paraguariensis]|uniref:Uncharacterized protein n=1 Tax=Ilex paraguariensis TaxID=185542 RepID=A0ABC8V1T5_9AQUA